MKTHPTDLVSFVPGVVSVAVAIVALAGGLTLDVLATDWVWPTVLIGLGVLVLATAGLGRRRPDAIRAGADGSLERPEGAVDRPVAVADRADTTDTTDTTDPVEPTED